MSTTPPSKNGASFWLFAVLHLICCGIPLLLLSGVSLATLWGSWPWLAVGLAVLGVVGFAWYIKRGCPTCPRNEGRCPPGRVCRTDEQPVSSTANGQ